MSLPTFPWEQVGVPYTRFARVLGSRFAGRKRVVFTRFASSLGNCLVFTSASSLLEPLVFTQFQLAVTAAVTGFGFGTPTLWFSFAVDPDR